MLSFEKFLLPEEVNVTAGMVGYEPPMFAGKRIIPVDSKSYLACRNGKMMYHRWDKYITDPAKQSEIRDALDSGGVWIQCSDTQAMIELKRISH